MYPLLYFGHSSLFNLLGPVFQSSNNSSVSSNIYIFRKPLNTVTSVFFNVKIICSIIYSYLEYGKSYIDLLNCHLLNYFSVFSNNIDKEFVYYQRLFDEHILFGNNSIENFMRRISVIILTLKNKMFVFFFVFRITYVMRYTNYMEKPEIIKSTNITYLYYYLICTRNILMHRLFIVMNNEC